MLTLYAWLCVVMLNVAIEPMMRSVVMLCVIMLSVLAPSFYLMMVWEIVLLSHAASVIRCKLKEMAYIYNIYFFCFLQSLLLYVNRLLIFLGEGGGGQIFNYKLVSFPNKQGSARH
jgi:hypothetical protein